MGYKLINFFRGHVFYIALLILIASTSYYPFLTSSNIGGADARFYFSLLADSAIQIKNGIFPVYVGQSIYEITGLSQTNAPLYLIIGNLLNFITFYKLDYLLLQHLLVLITAIFSSLFLFICLSSIFPRLKFEAFLISILYISSPGIASIIYYMDSYYAFLATPFIPVVFYSLHLIFKYNSIKAYLSFVMSLALTWMAHPPIALWVSIFSFCIGAYLISQSKKYLFNFLISGLIFVCLIFWQVISIRNFGTLENIRPEQVSLLTDQIYQVLTNSALESLLPLNFGTKAYFWFQLGYGLWCFLFIGLVLFFIRPFDIFFSICLVSCIAIIILIFPNPLGKFLWQIFPDSIITISNFYPNTRIYAVLAALSCFVAFFSFDKVCRLDSKKLLYTLRLLLIFSTAWSLYQLTFLMVKGTSQTEASLAKSWLNTDNIQHSFYTMPTEFLYRELSTKSLIPDFQIRILPEGNVIKAFGIKESLLQKCFLDQQIKIDTTNHDQNKSRVNSLVLYTAELDIDTHYLFCGKVNLQKSRAGFYLANDEIGLLHFSELMPNDNEWQDLVFPIYAKDLTERFTNKVPITLSLTPSDNSLIELNNFHYTKFNPSDFEIRILSLTPLRVNVNSKSSADVLEIIKPYWGGYYAKVNGKQVEPLRSERGTILIPLNTTGASEITLEYKGTKLMRFSFWLSLLTWIICIAFFLLMPKNSKAYI